MRCHTLLAALAGLLALQGLGCDGLGRPIVGVTAPGDAQVERTCEVQPACVPVRTVPADHFDLPEVMPAHTPPLDCDADEVEDEVDNCPGIPNPTQVDGACASAVSDCERLASGALALGGADLRGCQLEGPIELTTDMDLTGAQLGCSALHLIATEPRRVLLNGAQVSNIWLRIEGPIEVEMNRTTTEGSRVSLEAGAAVSLDDSILRNTGLWLDPRAAIPLEGSPGPSIDVHASSLEIVTVREPSSARAARMRVDESSMTTVTINVPRLDVHATSIVGSRLAGTELSLQEVELTAAELRSDFLTIASSLLNDVIFDRCVDLRMSDSDAVDIDVPACEATRFRSLRTEIEASRLEGGVDMVEGSLLASVVVGAGPTSSFTERDALVNGVRFCDALGGAAFFNGELRCVGCGYDAFMGGTTVCVSNSVLFERGCPAVELAPSCE